MKLMLLGSGTNREIVSVCSCVRAAWWYGGNGAKTSVVPFPCFLLLGRPSLFPCEFSHYPAADPSTSLPIFVGHICPYTIALVEAERELGGSSPGNLSLKTMLAFFLGKLSWRTLLETTLGNCFYELSLWTLFGIFIFYNYLR